MISLSEYIQNRIDRITEQAFNRSKIYDRADNLSGTILEHLAKLYLKFDENDTNKHASDIAIWITDIALMKSKSGKRIKLSKLLFREWLPDNINKSSSELVYAAQNRLYALNRYDDTKIASLDQAFHNKCIQLLYALDDITITSKNQVQFMIKHLML